jgi:hypothetical protein
LEGLSKESVRATGVFFAMVEWNEGRKQYILKRELMYVRGLGGMLAARMADDRRLTKQAALKSKDNILIIFYCFNNRI